MTFVTRPANSKYHPETGLRFGIFAVLLLSLLYYFIRLPTANLNLAFYDDSETLYHTLALLNGKIPYLDDFNHHFEGYVLQFVLGAKIFGFSPLLIRQVAFVNQVAVAIGVLLCLRFFVGRWLALLGAAICITAREPFVLGFYQQHQINLFFVFILFLSLLHLSQSSFGSLKSWPLPLAFFLSGLVFTFDQRALALLVIPLGALALRHKPVSWQSFSASAGAFLLAPCLALSYLASHNALGLFIEQTLIFPAKYRSASKSFYLIFSDGLNMHRYLATQTPILFALALIGICALIRIRNKTSDSAPKARYSLMILCLLPLIAMPFFGSRDFDYYTVTWLPYLSIMAVLSKSFFNHISARLRQCFYLVLAAPILLPLYLSAHNLNQVKDYTGDGIEEVTAYLKENLKPSELLYVWGYRMDVYARVNRLAAYPFASTIFVQPDSQITDPTMRLEHVYPKYEKMFLELLKSNPPDVVVVFQREGAKEPSRAGQALNEALASSYSQEFESKKKDFLGKECIFTVFRRTSSTRANSP